MISQKTPFFFFFISEDLETPGGPKPRPNDQQRASGFVLFVFVASQIVAPSSN